jgi:hypothetical protein
MENFFSHDGQMHLVSRSSDLPYETWVLTKLVAVQILLGFDDYRTCTRVEEWYMVANIFSMKGEHLRQLATGQD